MRAGSVAGAWLRCGRSSPQAPPAPVCSLGSVPHPHKPHPLPPGHRSAGGTSHQGHRNALSHTQPPHGASPASSALSCPAEGSGAGDRRLWALWVASAPWFYVCICQPWGGPWGVCCPRPPKHGPRRPQNRRQGAGTGAVRAPGIAPGWPAPGQRLPHNPGPRVSQPCPQPQSPGHFPALPGHKGSHRDAARRRAAPPLLVVDAAGATTSPSPAEPSWASGSHRRADKAGLAPRAHGSK